MYEYEPCPPDAFTVALPLQVPQAVLVALIVAVIGGGSGIIIVVVNTQPLASVPVTVMGPPNKPLTESVVAPLLQKVE